VTLYRIYTEAVNVDWIVDTAAARFPAFTVLRADGFWQGNSESSLVLEFLTEEHNAAAVNLLAHAIKVHNAQNAVLVVSQKVDSTLI